MVNRISEHLPSDDDDRNEPPPFDDGYDDDDDDDPDDFACATVRDLNELGDDFDTHLKDHQELRERVRGLESQVGLLTVVVLLGTVLFVLHLIWGR